jgi:hypothetical protein
VPAVWLKLHSLLSLLCIFNNIVQARMVAQKAISKGQRMGTWSWSLLHAFGKICDPNFNHPAILKAPQGL